eukprot:2961961-Amphidinium_carterae.1
MDSQQLQAMTSRSMGSRSSAYSSMPASSSLGINSSYIKTDKCAQRLHHVGRHLYLSATVIPGHHKTINITDPTLIGAIHNLPADFMLPGVATNDQAELSREGIKAKSPDTPIKPSDEE